MWLPPFLFCVTSYLLGSIPSGYIAGRSAGVDVRKHGSGNVGATNVLRVMGKAYGYAVFAADVLKGLGAVRIAIFVGGKIGSAHPDYYGVLAAVFVIIGHTFPIWLRFHGGKGVATSVGAMLGLVPLAAVITFLIWLLVFQVTRYVSLASIVGAVAMPVTVALLRHFGLTNEGGAVLYFASIMALLILWRHRSNFFRLVAGTEQRFERK
jgi:glycerol-3-phosphate acyltransferase PlsY